MNSISNHSFKVVFVTAYNEYALQAIKASALDYILKPVKIDELQEVVNKIKKNTINTAEKNQDQHLLQHFLESITKKELPRKIALPSYVASALNFFYY